MWRDLSFRCLIFLTMLCVDATVAFARAGGGGGYSGGGGGGGGGSYSSSSSSYSGGSSSGGSGEFTLFDFLFLVFALVMFVVMKRGEVVRKRLVARHRKEEAESLAGLLRERDPGFDLASFEERVRGAFLQIQQAWSEQDLGRVRGFMSDGVHERFSIQLREQQVLGYRNRMSDVRVLGMDLVEARVLPQFDVVSVRIQARASDVRIDARTDREIPGTRRSERFTEYWSFLRGRPAAGGRDSGLFEGQCPNCAAPIEPERAWSCESCGSQLDSAPPDWVLTEITQACEWSGRIHSEPRGLKEIVARDPGLTEQQLEDRASVLYWRLVDSDRRGDVSELESVSRPSFLERQQSWLDATGNHYIGDCAVGAVKLIGLLPGDEWDRALIDVRWSGGGYTRDGSGGGHPTGSRIMRRSLLVMARRAGAKSLVGRCVVSAHCSSCGAPDEGALEGRCGFCGEALNDGRDWLIERFLAMGDAEARMLRFELEQSGRRDGPAEAPAEESAEAPKLSVPGGASLFGWCLRLAYADQELDARERRGLNRLATRLGLPKSQARELTRAAQFGRLEVDEPLGADEARRWLDELKELAGADGRTNRRERMVLADLARRAGIEGPGAA